MTPEPLVPRPGEAVIVCCIRQTEPRPSPLALRGQCRRCGAPVWMAPNTIELMKKYALGLTICMECKPLAEAEARDAMGPGGEIVRGTVREATAQFKQHNSDAARNN